MPLDSGATAVDCAPASAVATADAGALLRWRQELNAPGADTLESTRVRPLLATPAACCPLAAPACPPHCPPLMAPHRCQVRCAIVATHSAALAELGQLLELALMATHLAFYTVANAALLQEYAPPVRRRGAEQPAAGCRQSQGLL